MGQSSVLYSTSDAFGLLSCQGLVDSTVFLPPTGLRAETRV